MLDDVEVSCVRTRVATGDPELEDIEESSLQHRLRPLPSLSSSIFFELLQEPRVFFAMIIACWNLVNTCDGKT